MVKKAPETDPPDRLPPGAREHLHGRTRFIIGIAIATVFAVAYVLVATSYRAGIDLQFTAPTPPANGVALVFAPVEMSADERTVSGDLLLFADPGLANADGELKQALEVEVYPSLSQGTLTFEAGKKPSPIAITLPASGIVQQYPFDRYAVAFSERSATVAGPGAATAVPSTVSVFFQIPGWGITPPTDTAAGTVATQNQISQTVVRSGSTKVIAILLLLLMIVLAVIAVVVVQSTATGSMRLELGITSWITAMLFALLPIRGFLPGDPPIGSWIDILVFFWVEGTIMVCVALAATGLIVRSRHAQP